ncbi:MAG TPA: hypothetical protein VH186_35820 [Chloroflexia bacterium]|nr:hypothetical protein [Chloroflexia bacterium]
MTLVRFFRQAGLILFFIFINNFFLLALAGFFAYRTFIEGKLNWAVLVLLVSLLVFIACRVIFQYGEKATHHFFYRGLVLTGAGLFITAFVIQTWRFIEVFVPTMTEVTPAKILVRLGIATANFYVYALIFAFIYYLYAHNMTTVIWNGSVDRLLRNAFSPNERENWRRVHFSNLVLMRTFFWGGLASVVTLTVGLVAWLLR